MIVVFGILICAYWEILQLREMYQVVEKLSNLSGLPWDAVNGLNIDEGTQPVWEAYVKVRS
jgi:hypothetical protein